MSSLATSFILGYHGCDRKVGESILNGAGFKSSKNDYDWLGPGVYFWEANPRRALDFAKEMQTLKRPKNNPIQNPFVVGSVIDLGNCLDLMSMTGIEEVRAAYVALKEYHDTDPTFEPLPTNFSPNPVFRKLDCAVINHLHYLRETQGRLPVFGIEAIGRFSIGIQQTFPAYDTVRGLFVEGKPIYKDSGFHEKTHIQICVRNHYFIKGVFRVPESHYR